uniref:Class II aldolase/adducin N-terminal domain-containing protein n=1 Tax=Ectopseudomonas oleovorans TaxID=301 RepID=A0A653AXD5_ECTOL
MTKARLQADLGDKNFMILPNHGLLTAFGSIADAFLGMFTLQRACEIQVMAQGATELIHIPQQILDGARAMIAGVMKTQQGMGALPLPWPALLRKLDQQMPGYDQ